MPTRKAIAATKGKDVDIFVGKNKCTNAHGTFQLCPLGLQFHSPEKVEDLTLMEFKLRVPPRGRSRKAENIVCTGAVVRCQKENAPEGRYRVWIQFLDLPEKTRERLKCISCKSNYLCSYCENF